MMTSVNLHFVKIHDNVRLYISMYHEDRLRLTQRNPVVCIFDRVAVLLFEVRGAGTTHFLWKLVCLRVSGFSFLWHAALRGALAYFWAPPYLFDMLLFLHRSLKGNVVDRH
jgi:hypothetical protein